MLGRLACARGRGVALGGGRRWLAGAVAEGDAGAAVVAEGEAAGVDHRTIGLQQGLWSFHVSSPGSPYFLPAGLRLYRRLEGMVRAEGRRVGFEEVVTPQLFRPTLWRISGHWDNYREDMFAVRSAGGAEEAGVGESEGRAEASAEAGEEKGGLRRSPTVPWTHVSGDASEPPFGLKPMNCPAHCAIFGLVPRTEGQLPLRLAELSALHRNEASGALGGLTRVRRFHQDDGHVFCTPAGVAEEVRVFLESVRRVYRLLGFDVSRDLGYCLSTRPERRVGDDAQWTRAETQLAGELAASVGSQYEVREGDGAFYGPKIDIRVKDARGRSHQLATVQLDFNLPERFGLAYQSRSGQLERPVLVHRAILGSFERALAVLAEHCSPPGAWPFWLSPFQVRLLPLVGDAPLAATRTLARRLRDRDVSVEVDEDARSETLARRIRNAALQRWNAIAVVGEREASAGTVSFRPRDAATAHLFADALLLRLPLGPFPGDAEQDRAEPGHGGVWNGRRLPTLHVDDADRAAAENLRRNFHPGIQVSLSQRAFADVCEWLLVPRPPV